ncbi:MAG: hypothetical protein LBE70_03980 [Nitrososphaerota archaeon]|nr:hypothetical protein [Nitrososphaerota archaeon]
MAQSKNTCFAHTVKIYCIGGEFLDHTEEIYIVYNVLEVYDIATDSWSVKKDGPFNGLGIQAHFVDGKLFVISGRDLFMYNPLTDDWIQKTSTPHPEDIIEYAEIYDVFSVAIDNKISVYFKYQYAFLMSKGKVMNYDTITNVWNEGKNLPEVYRKTTLTTTGCMTTGVYAPKKVYVFGLGDGPGQPVLSNWVHDPIDDIWSSIKNMPTYRDQFGIAVVNDILYVIGGKDAWEYDLLSINEQYIPKDYNGTIPPVTPPIITETLNVTNEPSNTSKFSFKYVFTIAAVITSGIVITTLFVYSKTKKEGLRKIRRGDIG